MTEQDWLAATDPTPMLEFLRDKATSRKLRLFAVAGCRHVLHLMTDARSRAAVEVAERYADGLATEAEREAAWEMADEATTDVGLRMAEVHGVMSDLYSGNPATVAAANAADADEAFVGPEAELFYLAANPPDAIAGEKREKGLDGAAAEREERGLLVALLRDVAGPLPFRPVGLDPAWLTATVTALARQIYDGRTFSLMPILADALQDAGCDDPGVLAHCRDAGPHEKGCWVIDLLLGKT